MTARIPSQWAVTDAIPIADTVTSRVYRVTLADGGSAVVKQLKPIGLEEELRGGDYLAWRGGIGAVRLLARDGGTFLLEDAGDVALLETLDKRGDDWATDTLIDVLGMLHSPSAVPVPADLEPLHQRFHSLFRLADSRSEPDAARRSMIGEAAAEARVLLEDQHDVGPLHGDLHHENVLESARGWVAIDPKGLIGDRAYDAANLFYNPLGRDDLRLDPRRIGGIAARFARRFGRERRTVLRYGFAHACLSASWHLEDGETLRADESLRVAAAIRDTLARPD